MRLQLVIYVCMDVYLHGRPMLKASHNLRGSSHYLIGG